MKFLETLLLFEAYTMLELLFWSNLFIALMVLFFETTTKFSQDKNALRIAILTRLCFSIAYLLLLFRPALPYIVSVNIGNCILFLGFYLDAVLMLSFLSDKTEKHYRNALRIIFVGGIVIFNIIDLIVDREIGRTITSSLIILAIYGVPSVSFIVRRISNLFKRLIGGVYVLFLISICPRIVIPFTELRDSAQAIAIADSGFYLVLMILTICGSLSTLLFIKEKSDIMIENMALNDQLTQIPNRHCFFLYADSFLSKCQREKRELSILFTDIDHFKKVNDNYGHDFGDVVLKRFATVIKESVRKYDLYCRYGGEEFLIMMECDKTVVENLALRIMERLKLERFEEHPDFKFTISVGICTCIPGNDETLDNYINKADTALYAAKNGGRNTIRFYQNINQ